MKICVYTICKNESENVKQWLDALEGVDYIVVLDTGSTDNTFELLKADERVTKVKKKVITPWRFDVARNEAMKLIPKDTDVCVSLDLDERFDAGWVDVIRKYWKENTTQMAYRYSYAMTSSGERIEIQKYGRIHKYGAFHWEYPVHEVLKYNEKGKQDPSTVIDVGFDIYLKHYQDITKPRGNYFTLNKQGCDEYPTSAVLRIQYARNLMLKQDFDSALSEYDKCLDIIDIDDSMSEYDRHVILLECILRKALIYYSREEYYNAIWYCHDFIKQDSSYREPYLLLAEIYTKIGVDTLVEGTIDDMLKHTKRHFTWVEMSASYTTWMYDVRSVAREHLGNLDGALADVNEALVYEPNNVNLLNNKVIILEKLNAATKLKIESLN